MVQATTRIFRSGNSEAVRLPKAIAYGREMDVTVERNGDVITIRPLIDGDQQQRRWRAMRADMEAIGAPLDGVQAREPFDFPLRRGLYNVDEGLDDA